MERGRRTLPAERNRRMTGLAKEITLRLQSTWQIAPGLLPLRVPGSGGLCRMMLFHLRIPPKGGIAESRKDRFIGKEGRRGVVDRLQTKIRLVKALTNPSLTGSQLRDFAHPPGVTDPRAIRVKMTISMQMWINQAQKKPRVSSIALPISQPGIKAITTPTIPYGTP